MATIQEPLARIFPRFRDVLPTLPDLLPRLADLLPRLRDLRFCLREMVPRRRGIVVEGPNIQQDGAMGLPKAQETRGGDLRCVWPAAVMRRCWLYSTVRRQ